MLVKRLPLPQIKSRALSSRLLLVRRRRLALRLRRQRLAMLSFRLTLLLVSLKPLTHLKALVGLLPRLISGWSTLAFSNLLMKKLSSRRVSLPFSLKTARTLLLSMKQQCLTTLPQCRIMLRAPSSNTLLTLAHPTSTPLALALLLTRFVMSALRLRKLTLALSKRLMTP